MSFLEKLEIQIVKSNSYLCVGLDPVWEKIPAHLPRTPEGLLEYLMQIVQSTQEFTAVYKPNFAYFEALGPSGMEVLQNLIQQIPDTIPVIGDAKRGDVGHTAQMYAKAIFETFQCDAVTATPYQGKDALDAFLEYEEKGVFVLCLTSNQGAADFQLPDLHLKVAEKVKEWNVNKNAGLVVGATQPDYVRAVREASGPMPYLIPGVGAQGGDLARTLEHASDGSKTPFLINSSRNILYASSGEDYAEAAGNAAKNLRDRINLHCSPSP